MDIQNDLCYAPEIHPIWNESWEKSPLKTGHEDEKAQDLINALKRSTLI